MIRIALEQADIVDREAEAIARDLTECDLVPLPVRMRSRDHGHLAVAVHAHEGAFPAAVQAAPLREIAARPGAGLVDEGSKPESHQNAVRAQPRLFASQRGIVGQRQEPLQQRRRIAGVIDASSRRGIRKFGPRDEIALPHLHHIDT